MTYAEFAAARKKLGLTQKQMARVLEMPLRVVQMVEAGPHVTHRRKVPVRAERLITAYLDGWRPADWPV